jgi:hypothetical protein
MGPWRRKFKPFLWAGRPGDTTGRRHDTANTWGCGIFATLGQYFNHVTVPGGFSAPMSLAYNIGGRRMGIDTLLLILLLTFGAGFILNRMELGRKTRRFG